LEIPSQNTINNGISPSVLEGETINNQIITNSPYWKIEGDLKVKSLYDNLEVKIFLVSGEISFESDLNLRNTLPVFIAQGDIKIKPQIHNLTGVLISSGTIKTGEAKEEQIFTLNGVAIAQKFLLERERYDNQQAAEFFVYDPKIPILLTPFMGKSSHLWEELPP